MKKHLTSIVKIIYTIYNSSCSNIAAVTKKNIRRSNKMMKYEEITKRIEEVFKKDPLNIIEKALHYAVYGQQGGTCRMDLDTGELYSMILDQLEYDSNYIDVLEIEAHSPLLEELEKITEEGEEKGESWEKVEREDFLINTIVVLDYEKYISHLN